MIDLIVEESEIELDVSEQFVEGGGGANLQPNKTVTPTTSQAQYLPDSGYDGLEKFTVKAIPSEYIVPSGTKNITANGNNQDVKAYEKVNVNVPNSYAAADEGKVVSNGALVAQTSDTVTQNGTVDTTLIDELTVNVGGGGGCKLYPAGIPLNPPGEEGVYYVKQNYTSDNVGTYDRGWKVYKWEDNHYVDITGGYQQHHVYGNGTGDAVWDINALGYNFSDIYSAVQGKNAVATISVELGGQGLNGQLYRNGNNLTCSQLFVSGNSVNGFSFDVINGGGGVPKISSPVQVVNGAVTDLTPYISVMTTHVDFDVYAIPNFGPIS